LYNALHTRKAFTIGRTDYFRLVLLIYNFKFRSAFSRSAGRVFAISTEKGHFHLTVTMTLAVEHDLNWSNWTTVPMSKVVSFESYRSDTHTHTADRLLYLDYKVVDKILIHRQNRPCWNQLMLLALA